MKLCAWLESEVFFRIVTNDVRFPYPIFPLTGKSKKFSVVKEFIYPLGFSWYMSDNPEARFKKDVNIGDKVRFQNISYNVGTQERTTETIEGYVAKKGWLLVYISQNPVDSEVGLLKARRSPYRYFGYPKDYEVLSKTQGF